MAARVLFSFQNVLGCGLSPGLSWLLGARVVLRGLPVSSLLCALRVSRRVNSRHPYAGTRFPSTPPANRGEPCQPSQTPLIQFTGWVTQGDQQHPATFSFHLILCTVYTIAKHTDILAFIFRFYSHVMYLLSSKAQQHLYAFLPLNLCYLPPSMQVHLLMHNV